MTSSAPAAAGARTENTREETGPAVKNGIVRYVSVSQIQTFDPQTFGGCHRKWWFDKVANLAREETEAQRKGKIIHSEIEHWLKFGEDVLSMTARQGKHFFPDRRHYVENNLLIEHPVGTAKAVHLFDEWRSICDRVVANSNGGADVYEAQQWRGSVLDPALERVLVIGGDVPLIGYIDVVNGSGFWTDNEGVEHKDTADLEVIDWKTTSNIAQHAKTPEQLLHSVQMVGYAKWASQVFPQFKTFRLSHGNLQTRGRAAEKRTAIIDLDSVHREWQHAVSTVKAMKHVAKEADVKNVEAHLPSCTAYRGCPYTAQCPKSPEQTLMLLFGKVPDSMAGKMQLPVVQSQAVESKGDKKMGMADFLTKQAGGGSTPTAAQPQVQATPGAPPQVVHEQPATKPVPTQAEIEAEKAQLAAEAVAAREAKRGAGTVSVTPGATEVVGYCPACGVGLSAVNSSRLPSGVRIHIACPKQPAQVLPPDAPKPTFAASAEPVPGESILMLPPEVQARAQAHNAAVAQEAASKAPGGMAGALDALQGALATSAAGIRPIEGIVEGPALDPSGQVARPGSGQAAVEPEAGGRKCSVCKQLGHTARTCTQKAAAEKPAVEQTAAQGQQSLPLQSSASAQVPASPTQAEAAQAAQVIAEVMAGATLGIELYVDCLVEGLKLQSLDEYVAEKNKMLAVAAKLPEGFQDVRYAGPDTSIGFGKWKGALAALVQTQLPPPGRYSLNFVGEDELKQCVVAALKPHCTVFVRGVK